MKNSDLQLLLKTLPHDTDISILTSSGAFSGHFDEFEVEDTEHGNEFEGLVHYLTSKR